MSQATGYQRLSMDERICIQVAIAKGASYGQISKELNRSKSAIIREVGPWGRHRYKAEKAHQYAQIEASSRKRGKVKINNQTLIGVIGDKLALRWSPEQISRWLKINYPDQPAMQASHETIYQYIYVHCKKTLREELTRQLRQEKKKRGRPRKDPHKPPRGRIADAVSIDERPAEVIGRQVPGHWEGDLVIGKDHKSAIGTLAERTTRTIIIVPLKAFDATSVREAFEKELLSIPEQMRKTLTYDNGKEMTQHKTFTDNTKIAVYFAHPYSPWERPTNENSNMLIRDYLPKGTDFSLISDERLKQIQYQLNTRPRKTLEWKTPMEVFERLCLVEVS